MKKNEKRITALNNLLYLFLLFLFVFLPACKKKQPENRIAYNVSDAQQEASLFKDIFDAHYKTLRNTQIKHSPLFIFFSGTPGMGKTYIAKILEERFQLVRINTDQIRNILRSFNVSNREALVEKYLYYFMQNYNQPNKSIILDASIDRRYKTVFPYLEKRKIPYIVIRLDVPLDVAIERIKNREQNDSHFYLSNFDRWYADYIDFAKTNNNYYLFNNLNPDFDGLFEYINHMQEKF